MMGTADWHDDDLAWSEDPDVEDRYVFELEQVLALMRERSGLA